jgi:FtsH-binding integral membrane protein
MADSNNWLAQGGSVAQPQTGVVVDQGLRSYMLGVYNYMAAAMVMTGLIAFATFSMAVTSDPTLAAQGARMLRRGLYLTPFGTMIFASPLAWVVMLAPLGFALFLGFRVHKMSVAGAQIAFWLFAGVMGLSLSSIFLRFTGQSITQVFFITAATFALLSLYGYTTKKDLSGWGTFLIMGVIGLIVASIVNIFLQSPMMSFVISAIGVLVFAGLTAYDTQQIKDGYYEIAHDAVQLAKGSIMGALTLYLDFINMFTSLLNLMGDRE